MLRLPPTVGVKVQLTVSDTLAADGTLLEWLSVSEGSSGEEYSSDESNFSDDGESILVSDTDPVLYKSDLGTV